MLSTILNEPLWTLAVSFAEWVVAAIPNCPLSTLTDGRVAIPSATSVASFIIPVGVLENPTSVTFTYSSLIFKKSDALTELIPLNTNWVSPIATFESNVWEIDVKFIGVCTTPSRPIIDFVNCFVIDNLCKLPAPVPVNVTAAPVATYSGLVNNWNLFSSRTLANTVLGNIVVTIPAVFAVEPIETAEAATPTNVDVGV